MVKIHILNVGHGNCLIIEHAGGRITMVDINNGGELDPDTARELPPGGGEPLTNPVEYFLKNFPGRSIWRFIATHPDLDHLRGLAALRAAGIGITNLWDTEHNKELTEFKTDADKADWLEYQRLRGPNSPATVLRLLRGSSGVFWNQDNEGGGGDGLHILAPTLALRQAANASDDANAHSYVLWLVHGGRAVCLGGDATPAILADILATYGANLKCAVLKASHHGRESGWQADFVKACSPDYAIVSVGKKPETDASNKYRQYAKNVWSTRFHGNIVVTVPGDGSAITVTSDKTRREAAAKYLAALLGVRRAA